MRQFDFARNWPKVRPLLDDRRVQGPLDMGMSMMYAGWKHGAPPGSTDAGRSTGREQGAVASPGISLGAGATLSPRSPGPSGRVLYPDLKWGFYTSEAHTVAVGHRKDKSAPPGSMCRRGDAEWVMDILLFRKNTAEDSIQFVNCNEDMEYSPTLVDYLVTFIAPKDHAVARRWLEEEITKEMKALA